MEEIGDYRSGTCHHSRELERTDDDPQLVGEVIEIAELISCTPDLRDQLRTRRLSQDGKP